MLTGKRAVWIALSVVMGAGCGGGSAEPLPSSDETQDPASNDQAPAGNDQQVATGAEQPETAEPSPSEGSGQSCSTACDYGAGCDLSYCIDRCVSELIDEDFIGCERQWQAAYRCIVGAGLLSCSRPLEPTSEDVLLFCRSPISSLSLCQERLE
jgi:hypothetical protein